MEDHEKIHSCKLCGKTFPCGRSLGGHMRSHLIPFPSSSSHHHHHHHHHETTYDQKLPEKSLSSLSSLKGSTLLDHVLVKNPKKINEPSKTSEEYSSTQIMNNLSSSSLSYASNYSPPISNIIDQQEEEEVALSLIILSQDKGEWDCTVDPVFELSDDSSGFLDPKTTLKIKEIGKSRSKTRKLDVLGGKSPEKRIKSRHNHLGFGKESEFKCSVCNKAFSSYQALGGHRASHKKFNGSCAPKSKAPFKVNYEDNKEHECSICYRVFPSGQALGGHKRSHLAVGDREAKKNEIRKFFDLNLPAPDNEEE